MFIPPVLIPAFDVPRPAELEGSGTNGLVYNDSAIWSNYIFRQNQIAADIDTFYLIAGLWRLDFHVETTWADLTTQNYLWKMAVVSQGGTRADLYTAYWDRVADGHRSDDFTRLVHIKPRPDISVVQGDSWHWFTAVEQTNAVATQEIQIQISVNAHRFL